MASTWTTTSAAAAGCAGPATSACSRDITTGRSDIILCTEQTRLTRGRISFELEGLIDMVNEAGVDIATLRGGGLIDLSTSGGRAQARILGVMARLEVEQMSERIRSKLAQDAEAGKAHGGPRPFGYQHVDGRLVLDPGEADVIAEMGGCGCWLASRYGRCARS